jgi:hypothetical protein
MAWTDAHRLRLEGLQEIESQKVAHVRTIILVERRDSPHIRYGEVQSAITIDISHSDTSTHLGLREP